MTTRKDLARDAILEAIPAIAAAYRIDMTDDMVDDLEAMFMVSLDAFLENIGVDPDVDSEGNRW